MTKRRLFLILLLLTALMAGLVTALLWFRQSPIPPPDLEPVTPPPGAQLLIFPIDSGLITAGYLNANYREKNGYPHYGIDLTTTGTGEADIIAPGNGTVLGTEWCDNNLGYIAVIRHDNVYLPETGVILPLIGRYYHMTALHIQEGDTVTAGQVIGTIHRRHRWRNHIHLELDADISYPFHTPQVAEASSQFLHRYPANGEQMLEPISILAVGGGQRIAVHPGSSSCTEKDEPRYMTAE